MAKQEENKTAKIVSAENVIIDEFIKDLQATANQVQQLLIEIRDSKVDLATIKAEFKFVVENVKQLSYIIRDDTGHGSMVTKLALVESDLAELKQEVKEYIDGDIEDTGELNTKVALIGHKLNEITHYIDNIKKKEEEKEENKKKTVEADKTGKWQLYVAIAGGAFTLLGSIIALLMSIWGK